LEKVKAMVQESKPQFATLLKKVQDDYNTLQESGLDFSSPVSLDDLEDHVSGFSSSAEKRLAELEKQLQLEKDRDSVREDFAKAANGLKAKLDQASNALLKLGESSPEDGLKGLEGINQDIADAKADVTALKDLDAKQKELDILVNDRTKESVGSLEAKQAELEKISEKMANDFENAKNSGDAKLTPKQVKELKKIFDEFAKAGELKTAGFHTACTGMGIVLTDDEAEDMFGRADADKNGSISFDEFLSLMEEQLLSSSSKEDVLNSFKTMSGGKDAISSDTLKQHFGNFEGVFGYLTKNMSEDGDYNAFTDELFSR
jgi:Ca2+-binding EF-hand superfamily protein